MWLSGKVLHTVVTITKTCDLIACFGSDPCYSMALMLSPLSHAQAAQATPGAYGNVVDSAIPFNL